MYPKGKKGKGMVDDCEICAYDTPRPFGRGPGDEKLDRLAEGQINYKERDTGGG